MDAEAELPGVALATAGEPGQTSLLGGSTLLLWAQLISAAGFFVSVLLLARGLGPEGRGTIAFVSVTALLICRIARVGVAEAAAILAAQRPAARPALLGSFVLMAVPSALVVALLFAGVLLIADPRPAGVGPIELIALVFGAFGIVLGEGGGMFLLGCKRFVARAVLFAGMPWIYAALLAALSFGPGLTVSNAAIAWAVSMTAGGALSLAASIRVAGLEWPARGLMQELMRLGLRLWVGTLSSFLNLRIDQILIGFISTQATLGIYAVAVSAAEALLYVPMAIGDALFPFLASGGDRDRASRTLRTVRLLVLSTTLSVVAAALFGPSLMPLVFGAAFNGSVVPFLWLLPGALGYTATKVFSNALATSSTPGRYSLPPLVSFAVGAIIDLLLIPQFGASGAAVAATAAYLAGGASALLLYRSRNPFPLGALIPRADATVGFAASAAALLLARARAAIGRLRSLLPAV